MKHMLRSLPCLIALGAIGATTPAQAHFKLTKPAPWIVEDDLGDPQKAGPCGPDGSGGMMTNEITTVEAGSTIEVEYVETIHHPGWFRISLAEDRSEFEDIEFPNTNNCNYDMSTVPEEPHGNVLADGLAKDENLGGANRMFKETIKIPDTPCEKCTLQVIQVMADAVHRPPGCIYYHCADLKIVAAGGGTAAAGSSGSAGAAGAAIGGSSAPSSAGTAAPASGGTGGTTATAPSAGSGGAASASKPTTTTASGGAAGTGTTSGSATASSGTAGKAAVPATTSSGSAGSSSSGKSETSSPAADTDAATSDEGGCAVTHPGSRSGLGLVSLLSVVGLLFGIRRRQRVRA